jgi:hypothetical protein
VNDEANDTADDKTVSEVKDENKVQDKSEVKDENKDEVENSPADAVTKDKSEQEKSTEKQEPVSSVEAAEVVAAAPESAAAADKSAPQSEKDAPVSLQKLTAPEKMASVVPVKTPRRQAADLSIFDLAVGVLLLVLLSQLVANSYIAYLGRSYNERVCKESIALASEAANKGEDTPHVQLAAFGSMLHCPMDGLFIEHPELISFKDDIDPLKKTRIITICSSTKVRVPASFLIFDKSCLVNRYEVFPEIAFKSTYQYKLTNPKGIADKFIRDSSGKLISRPAKAVKGAKGVPTAKPADKAPTPAPGSDAKAAPAPGTGDGQ